MGSRADVTRKVRALEKERDGGSVRKAGRTWTVEQSLTHWVENIAAPFVRENTIAGYRVAVNRVRSSRSRPDSWSISYLFRSPLGISIRTSNSTARPHCSVAAPAASSRAPATHTGSGGLVGRI